MNNTEQLQKSSLDQNKDREWLAHRKNLTNLTKTVGGAGCQSRFSSSKTAIPIFREEARSACCAADGRGENAGARVTTATVTATTTGTGRRCGEGDTGREGSWRYCFDEMKWVLDTNGERQKGEGAGGRDDQGHDDQGHDDQSHDDQGHDEGREGADGAVPPYVAKLKYAEALVRARWDEVSGDNETNARMLGMIDELVGRLRRE